MNLTLIVILIVATIAAACVIAGLRVIKEHERGVVFQFGRFARVVAPGLRVLIPFGIERLVRVDTRASVTVLAPKDMTTADQAPVRVVASMHAQVLNPQLAVTKIAEYRTATQQAMEATLRAVVSRVMLSALLNAREFVNEAVQR